MRSGGSCSPKMGGSVAIYDRGCSEAWRYEVVQRAFLHPDSNVGSATTLEEARELKAWAEGCINRERNKTIVE